MELYRKSQRNRPGKFECSTKLFSKVTNHDSRRTLDRKLRMDRRASAKPDFANSLARRTLLTASEAGAVHLELDYNDCSIAISLGLLFRLRDLRYPRGVGF